MSVALVAGLGTAAQAQTPAAPDTAQATGKTSANVLLGGVSGQVTLQPVSVEGSVGLNVAAGVAEVELKYAR